MFAEFVSENVDKVELLYTRFVSLISSRPVVQTLLPLTASGQVCTVNGVCVDAKDDEVFALTSEDGKFAVKREAAPVDTSNAVFDGVITFEQDPNQILDALLPLYMNSQVLRALQESIASELAARMTAMGAASDNAKSLGKALNLSYNRQRQAKSARPRAAWLRAACWVGRWAARLSHPTCTPTDCANCPAPPALRHWSYWRDHRARYETHAPLLACTCLRVLRDCCAGVAAFASALLLVFAPALTRARPARSVRLCGRLSRRLCGCSGRATAAAAGGCRGAWLAAAQRRCRIRLYGAWGAGQCG